MEWGSVRAARSNQNPCVQEGEEGEAVTVGDDIDIL